MIGFDGCAPFGENRRCLIKGDAVFSQIPLRFFVVPLEKAEFRMTEEQAYRVMITAHKRGVCVVAVFEKDVAETKATRATEMGRSKGYPLRFTTEPEE